MQATRVTFPDGSTTGEGEVLLVDREASIIVVDSTPFHPVDHTWPDQPGDAGRISLGDAHVRVTEAVMAAVSDDGRLAVGADIPVKRGGEGWTWLVGHRVEGVIPDEIVAGARVTVEVDADRRTALSRGHTACHLASLALDAALADLWRKEIGTDPLGNPDFEGRANQSSRIVEDGSVDEYRLGKSLRKAGFDSEGFAATLAEREARINEQLETWVASDAESRIDTEGETIIDRRAWRCALPEGEVGFPCGGTHVRALGELGDVSVTLDLSDPQLLVMTTRVAPTHI